MVIMLFWSLAFANNFVISLISKTFVQIHKLLLPIFLEREAGQQCRCYLFIGLLTPYKEIQCPIFRMAQACEGHVSTSIDLTSKRVSKLSITWHHHF